MMGEWGRGSPDPHEGHIRQGWARSRLPGVLLIMRAGAGRGGAGRGGAAQGLARWRGAAQPTSRSGSAPAVDPSDAASSAAVPAGTSTPGEGTAVGGGSEGESATVRVAPMPR